MPACAGCKSRYYFGDDESRLTDYAWYEANSGGGTHPVGRKKPNAWGLYDMNGNVWQWCADRYDDGNYRTSPRTAPSAPDNGDRAVVRGGCWRSNARFCRSAMRFYENCYVCGSEAVGFRVCRGLEK